MNEVIPFQTVTRSRSQVLAAELSNVKIISKKINPQLVTQKKVTSFKPKFHAGHVKKGKTPPVKRKKSGSRVSKKQKNQNKLSTPLEIELIDLSSPPTVTGKKTSLLPIKGGTKRTLKTVAVAKTKVRKQTVSGAVIKKISKVSSVNNLARKHIKTQPKSKTLQSTSVQKTYKGSKNCCDCSEKEENIYLLQCRLKELEEQEVIVQRRLRIYDGLGVNQVEKDEENKVLLKKKDMLEAKLTELKKEMLDFLEGEEEEINSLLCKKNTLVGIFKKKVKESEKFNQVGEEELKKLKEKWEKQKNSDAKEALEIIKLQEELYVLKQGWIEKGKEYFLKPKELPVVEKTPVPCEICTTLGDEGLALKKELGEIETEHSTLNKDIIKIVHQMLDGACDVAYNEYEIEYLKKRLHLEWDYHSDCNISKKGATYQDFECRQQFTSKVCKLMSTVMCNKRYSVYPKFVKRMPITMPEKLMRNDAKERGILFCCASYPKIYCKRFLCGTDYEETEVMTNKEKVAFEKTLLSPLELQLNPEFLQTAKDQQNYVDNFVLDLKRGVRDKKIKLAL